MSNLMSNAIFAGALSGFLAAVRIDYKAFKAWKMSREATTFDWRLAVWRWVEGAVAGALAASGLGWLA